VSRNIGDAIHWLELYREAVTEPDRDQLSLKISMAVEAIEERVQDLSSASVRSTEEKAKIDAALMRMCELLKRNSA
jgi:hypothetical protein